ncbi:MAG: extracellular solute-binding protein [Desulfobacterales bacterium]|nr:extracellular solute-binding protein [Desulfobacterales bacterium]
MSRISKICFLLLVCGVIMAVQPFPVHSDPLDPYIEGAKKEGSVTIGVTLREKVHGKPAGELYIAAFQKRYPFLKVTFKRIGGFRERERIVTEMMAGIFNYDVATASELQIDTLINAKLPRLVEWEKLGVPQFLVHPENIGVPLRTPVFGIAYNRDLVPDQVAQTFTWETCTDPKWKGKTAMDDRPRHLNGLYVNDAWGREKTLDYAKRWAANKPAIESSRSTAAAKLVAGAYHMVCGMQRTQVKDLQVHGEAKSLGMVFPEPVPVGLGELIYVPNKAKHPNAGVLFLAWTATQQAQNLLEDVNFSGHPSFEGTEVNKLLKGKKVFYATWKDSVHADEDLAKILQAMGMPVVRSESKKKTK